jgi:hypothetical protein
MNRIDQNNKKVYDKIYEPRATDKIHFGKYKNKPHSVLKEDASYCDWIMNTEDDFGQSTKWFITNHIRK